MINRCHVVHVVSSAQRIVFAGVSQRGRGALDDTFSENKRLALYGLNPAGLTVRFSGVSGPRIVSKSQSI